MLYFYSNSFLSNFSRAKFTLHLEEIGLAGTFEYLHAEQAIMHIKSLLMGDLLTAAGIMQASSPKDAKSLGRRVRPFDEAKWVTHRPDVARFVLEAKFRQNPDLGRMLAATHPQELAEAAPHDRVWGIGLSASKARKGEPWTGQNLLGKTLVLVRDS